MTINLTDSYNEGLVTAPEIGTQEPARLRTPAWQPTPAQVDAARKGLVLNLILVAVLLGACMVFFALVFGWGA